jgi:hypothetical protein
LPPTRWICQPTGAGGAVTPFRRAVRIASNVTCGIDAHQ